MIGLSIMSFPILSIMKRNQGPLFDLVYVFYEQF